MAQKDQTIENSMEIGRKNMALLPQVQRWCKHLEVRQKSAGLLAEISGLPISSLEVTCPHGISTGESMHMEWEARRFIIHNCAGCPHHQEQSPDNFGRQVFAEHEVAKQVVADAEARREALRTRAYSDAKVALATKQITEKSVNTLILALIQNQEHKEAIASRLVKAAHLGPEFFTDQALLVLADGFMEEYASSCIAVVREVCANRQSFPDEIIVAAQLAAVAGSDAACGLLADYVSAGGNFASALSLLPDVLAIPDYRLFRWRTPQGYHERPNYSGTHGLLSTGMENWNFRIFGERRADGTLCKPSVLYAACCIGNTLARSRSNFARPYMLRLTSLRRFT